MNFIEPEQTEQTDRECSLLPCNDLGFAQRLVKRYGSILQFWKHWYYFNGTYWDDDAFYGLPPVLMLLHCIEMIQLRESKLVENPEQYIKWSDKLAQVGHMMNTVKLARTLLLAPGLPQPQEPRGYLNGHLNKMEW